MGNARVRLGQRGEALAASELERQGYEIVDRNWRCSVGEVDIVSCRDEVWVFFEVRTRRGGDYGTPEESVTPVKRQRMIDVGRTYLGDHSIADVDWRVGLVAIEMNRAGHVLRLEVYDTLD